MHATGYRKSASITEKQYMQQYSSLACVFKKKKTHTHPLLSLVMIDLECMPCSFVDTRGLLLFEVFDLQGTLIGEHHSQLVPYPFHTISNCDHMYYHQLNQVR